MPGLSKEGWRDRNSVIKVGKAAASNLMSVVCGKQREIIEILGNDANGLKLSIFCAEGNATSSSPPAPGDHVLACPWVNYGDMRPLSDWVEGHISGCLVTFLHFQLLNQDSASQFGSSPCTAARTQNVRQLLLSLRHLTRDPCSAPGEEKLRIKKGKISKGTWHWNSLASWMLTRSHLCVEEALSLALCQSPFKNIHIYYYSQLISRYTPAT